MSPCEVGENVRVFTPQDAREHYYTVFDAGIVSALEAVREIGVNTRFSCSGLYRDHVESGVGPQIARMPTGTPYIAVDAPDTDEQRSLLIAATLAADGWIHRFKNDDASICFGMDAARPEDDREIQGNLEAFIASLRSRNRTIPDVETIRRRFDHNERTFGLDANVQKTLGALEEVRSWQRDDFERSGLDAEEWLQRRGIEEHDRVQRLNRPLGLRYEYVKKLPLGVHGSVLAEADGKVFVAGAHQHRKEYVIYGAVVDGEHLRYMDSMSMTILGLKRGGSPYEHCHRVLVRTRS